MKNKSTTPEQEKLILKDYLNNILTQIQILEKYQIKKNILHRILKQNNIKIVYRQIDRKTKYSYNLSAFKTINSEESAYFLGILMADGCIREGKSNWVVELTLTDFDVIKKFQTFLKTESPIKQQNKSTPEIKRKDSYTIYINNKEIVEDLAKLGIVNRKAYRTRIPELSDNLIRHFIRGYFDADGCIYVPQGQKTSRCHCSITSASKLIIEQINSYLKKINIFSNNKNYIYSRETYFTIISQTQTEGLDFLNYIYSDCSIYMDRKYNKYKEIINKPFIVKQPNSSSKYFGVYRKTDEQMKKQQTHKRFGTYLRHNNQMVKMGSFYTELEAAQAYNAKIKELGLPDYMLNKIEEETPKNPIIS